MAKHTFFLYIISIILFFGCKKQGSDSVLGLDIQPENDLLGITISDSASIFMHTQKIDSVRSYNDSYKYLGSVADPIFGRTDASIYTNISINNNLTNVTFGNNPELDSAEIVIRDLDSYLGDTTTVLDYEIHVLNEGIKTATNYYTNNSIPYSSSSIATSKGRYAVRSGFLCLVISVDQGLAQSILQNTVNLVSNATFQNANKGFYITTSHSNLNYPGAGSIRKLDLDDNLSGMNIYYHDGNSTSSKGEVFQFTFRGSDALRFNHIKHNYTLGATQNLFDQLNGDTLKGNTNIYLNCFGGTRTRVYLPFIKSFVDSQSVSISRAELILKVDETIPYSNQFDYPAELTLLGCSKTGDEELVYDQIASSDLIKYNGYYDKVNKQYVFNIAREMQKIITEKTTNNGFYLVNAIPSPAYAIRRDNRLNRVVFGGKSNMAYKPMFKVTYIKFPHE